MAPDETSGSDRDGVDQDEALLHAARDGDLAGLEALLAQGADVDHRDRAGSTALGWAASHGRADAVHRLILAGAVVDHVNEFGDTPLLMATYAGCAASVVDLLDHGADIEHSNGYGETALFIAAACPFEGSDFARRWPREPGHDPILRELLSRGAGVDVVDIEEISAVAAAGANGNIAAVRALYLAGAALGYEMEEGDRSLLRWAAGRGYLAVIEAELDAGVPIDDQDDDWSPLAHAAFHHQVAAVTLLLERGASVDDEALRRIGDLVRMREAHAKGAVEKIGRAVDAASAHFDYQRAHENLLTAYTLAGRVGLDEACQRTRGEMERLDSAFRAKILEAHHGQAPPLVAVAGHGYLDEVRHLLNCGGDIEQEDGEGVTALINAARHGRTEVVSDLLRHGASTDHADRAGNTPLLVAAEQGWAAIVRELALFNADVEHRNGKGQTALFLAASCPQAIEPSDTGDGVRHSGHDEVVRELLRAGADTEPYPTGDHQPVSAAANHGNIAAMLDILDAGGRLYSDEYPGIARTEPPCAGLVEAVWELVDDRPAHAEGVAWTYQGWTPLYGEQAARRPALLTALLEYVIGFSDQARALISERIAWLEARAEQAWERTYDAQGSSAAGFYSDAKGFLDDARRLALRIDRPDLARRISDRLAHIKAVFRSQFS